MIIKSKNENNKIKVALVGLGHISKKHLQAINALKDRMQLIAVCENNKELLEQPNLPKGTELYSDFSEMINSCGIDVISLCTPSGLHPQQTIDAAIKRFMLLPKSLWQQVFRMLKK